MRSPKELEKSIEQSSKKVRWIDGKEDGPIENQRLKFYQAASLPRARVQANMQQYLDDGYTQSEAAALEGSAYTLSGQLIISEVFAIQSHGDPSQVNDFYKDNRLIHEQKARRDAARIKRSTAYTSNRFSLWNVGTVIVGTLALAGAAYACGKIVSPPRPK